MRFNSVMANKYRKNGYLFVSIDSTAHYYDIFIQYPTGKAVWVDTFPNKSVAIKEAKRLAMTDKLGFNVDLDVVLERGVTYQSKDSPRDSNSTLE